MLEMRTGGLNDRHLPRRPTLDLRRHDQTCPMGAGKARIISGPNGPECEIGCKIGLTGQRPDTQQESGHDHSHNPAEHQRPPLQ